jgi:molecular chaperone DnaJ
VFGRSGDNLTVTVPISFTEAALGAAIVVPTTTGTVTLKVPAGTASGRTFRVRGKGVPTKDSAGDLMVTVNVIVPAEMSDEARAALESYATLSNNDDLRKDLLAAAKVGE